MSCHYSASRYVSKSCVPLPLRLSSLQSPSPSLSYLSTILFLSVEFNSHHLLPSTTLSLSLHLTFPPMSSSLPPPSILPSLPPPPYPYFTPPSFQSCLSVISPLVFNLTLIIALLYPPHYHLPSISQFPSVPVSLHP